MLLSAGDRLGPYEVLALIGAGGMGEVYKAHDTRLRRDVALKILPARFSDHADRHARFKTEARAASALNHPGIVTIYDIGGENGIAYMVTEFIDGDTLRRVRPEPLKRQLDIAAQLAEALAVAHTAGITHRDLKPENIMVTRDGRAKILDFGLARQAAPLPESDTLTVALTEQGTVLGTVGYMSPEQARGRAADHRSDVFSLGVVMYELFCGKRAFDGESPTDILSAILKTDPPDLPSSVPVGVRQIVEHSLEKDPARRFQSAHDLAFALRALSGSVASSPEAATGVPTVAAPPRQLRVWPIVATCGLVLLGLGFWRLATEPQLPDMSRYRFRPFATEDDAERFPSWSPDGKSIAYVVRRKSDAELVVKSLDGSPPAVVARSIGAPVPMFSISWTPDSSKLYYVEGLGAVFGPVLSVARAGGEPQRVGEGLSYAAALSPDGQTLATLAREEENGQRTRVLMLSSPPGSAGKRLRAFDGWALQNRIAWSPEGNKILLWLQGTPASSVWLVDARSGNAKSIPSPSGGVWRNFAWLRDNRHVIIAWPPEEGSIGDQTDLWLLDTETGQRNVVVPSTESLTDPTFSPDGSALAFTSGSFNFDLMELPLDGSPARPLLATGQWEDSADWSPVAPEAVYVGPDGIRLLRKESGLDRLIVTPSNLQGKVTRFASPSFSPDGTRIVYLAFGPELHRNVWISPVGGGAPAPLGDFEGLVSGVSWSPDGKWIALNWSATSERTVGQLAKIRVGASGKPTVLADQICPFIPSWSPDGSRILCSRDGTLFTMSSDGGTPEFLGKDFEPIAVWSHDIRYIYAIRNKDGKRRLGKLDWKSGEFQPIVDVPRDWDMNTPTFRAVRLSLSSDGKSIATTINRLTGDIWILEGFRPAPTLWQRLWKR